MRFNYTQHKQKGFATFSLHERGFAPILIVILVAILAAGGAYYFGYDHGWEKSVKQTSPTPTPSHLSSETSVKEEDPTADWKTYIDPAGFFSFQYPDSLRLKFPEGNVIDIEPNIVAENNGRPLVEGRDDEIFRLIITVREDPKIKNNPDLRESISELSKRDSFQGGPDPSQIEKTLKLYRNNAIEGFYYFVPDEASSPVMITQTFGGKIYEFWYVGAYGGATSQRS